MTREAIYFSPHFDDCAFSSSGLLIKTRFRPLLVNVFTRSQYSPYSARTTGTSITRLRTREDALFCRKLGLDFVNLKFPDSSLRGYDDCAELCTGADPVLPRVRNALERIILKFKPSVVFCPIGVGNHIDHNLTRQAIMCCVPRKSLVLCEDLPYAATYSLESVSLLAKQQNFDEILVDISNSVEGKKNAVRIYASQISKLEEDFIMGQSTRFRAGRNFERIFISKGGNKSRGVFTLDHLEISKY